MHLLMADYLHNAISKRLKESERELKQVKYAAALSLIDLEIENKFLDLFELENKLATARVRQDKFKRLYHQGRIDQVVFQRHNRKVNVLLERYYKLKEKINDLCYERANIQSHNL